MGERHSQRDGGNNLGTVRAEKQKRRDVTGPEHMGGWGYYEIRLFTVSDLPQRRKKGTIL